MKRFLILVLFSILIPIQNSSAVSPSLDETIDFLINGDSSDKIKWSIDDCVLTKYYEEWGEQKESHIIDLKKINLNNFETESTGFYAKCIDGKCVKFHTNSGWKLHKGWFVNNGVDWERNSKALSHLYANFCTGAKSAF